MACPDLANKGERILGVETRSGTVWESGRQVVQQFGDIATLEGCLDES